jgi:16S rRNA (guanine966-N2)-methyltransferase
MNEVRVSGGRFRGRKLHFPSVPGLRPTLDRVRETLFNWLMFRLQDAVCLDAFAGSGALGFEALSRGAARVDFVEQNHAAVLDLKRNQQILKLQDQSRVWEISALHLSHTMGPYDLIFLDPPFGQGLLERALEHIVTLQILKPGGLVYFEVEKRLDLALGEVWQLYRHKKMGDVQFGLLQIFC